MDVLEEQARCQMDAVTWAFPGRLEGAPAPAKPNKDAAKEQYKGCRVYKYFQPTEAYPSGGWNYGTVKKVRMAENPFNPGAKDLYFNVRYDDNDEEDMDWDEFTRTALAAEVDLEDELQRKRKRPSGATEEPAAGASGKRSRKQDAAQKVASTEHHLEMRTEGRSKRAAEPTSGEDEQEPAEEPLDARPQVPRKEFVMRKDGLPGQIYKIKLENFMCHANFAIEFAPHVNVISGQNGSGKSAVMQALQTCLGASARQTGRAPALANFIKTGASEARVQVTLYNTGTTDSYQPDKYGDRITIERRLTKSANPFKTLNANGKPVAHSKKEVEDILDHFGLNASNPLCVMTQDMARQFLCGPVSEKKKYELFMEGTCLEDFRQSSVVCDANLTEALDQLAKAKGEVEAAKKSISDLREKIKKLEELDVQRDMLELLEQAMFWAAVKAPEDKIHALRETVEVRGPAKLAELNQGAAKCEEKLQELVQKEREKTETLETYQREMQAYASDQQQLTQQLVAARKNCRVLQKAAQDTEGQVAELQQSKEALMKSLEEDKGAQATQRKELLTQHQHKVDELAAAVEASRKEFEEKRAQFRQVSDQLEGMRAQEQRLNSDIHGLQEQLHAAAQERQAALREGQDMLAKFGGNKVVALRRMVDQRAGAFSAGKPIGPIGAYIQLQDPKWATAIETAVGGLLNTFLVGSLKDAHQLKEFAKQCGWSRDEVQRLMVTATNFRLPQHNIPLDARPAPGWTSIMELLRVDDGAARPVIMNFLVDRAGIESTVLVESDKVGRDVVYNTVAGSAVRSAVDVYGGTYKSFGVTKSVDRPRERIVPRLGVNQQQVLEGIEEWQQRLNATLDEKRRELSQLRQEMYSLADQVDRLDGEVKAANTATVRSQSQLKQTRTQMPALEVEEADDSALVVEQLQAITGELGELQSTLEDLQRNLNTARGREEQLKQEQEAKKRSNSSQVEALQGLTQELQDIGGQKLHHQGYLDRYRKKIAETNAEIDRTQREIAALQAESAAARESAMQVCDEDEGIAALEKVTENHRLKAEEVMRQQVAKGNGQFASLTEEQRAAEVSRMVSVKTSPVELMKEHGRVEKKIEDTHNAMGGSKEELQAALAALNASEEGKIVSFERVRKKIRTLMDSQKLRQDKYKELFGHAKKGVSNKFRQYMWRRKHEGHVEVDDEAETLKLKVKINGAVNQNAKVVHDLKQLSGGERSYTTVAFLLALGEWYETPFRCMDEFDVFMDAVNRRIATETLLEFAMDNDDKQFIFLTPQDLQAVEDAKLHLEQRRGSKVPDGFCRVQQMTAARPS